MGEKTKDELPELYDHTPIYQGEDAALKTMARFFADELLPYFGIEGKVKSLAPTELVHIDITKLYQDMNFVMEDGTWKHFEFQSKNEGLAGLKRFRVYEALTSYQNNVSVTTYVLYSGGIQDPMTEFTEGGNTYRVFPIIMKDISADELFEKLARKQECGQEITRQDLVPMTLCMLMGGKMPMKDRVKTAYQITRGTVSANPEDIRKIEAVLYVMADKFLDEMSMEEIMEGIRMTRLGQMLVNAGKEEGKIEGQSEEKLKIARSLIGLLDETVIAERLELPLETVLKLKEEMREKK